MIPNTSKLKAHSPYSAFGTVVASKLVLAAGGGTYINLHSFHHSVQAKRDTESTEGWIPAFAGMTACYHLECELEL